MTRRFWLILPASAALWLPWTAAAQDFDGRIYGLAASNAELDRVRQARGFGLGADVGAALGSWRLEVRGSTASLHADFAIQPDYTVNELAVLGSYRWRPALALQVGAARRFTSPDFAAQDVGLLKVALLVETPLSSLARVRISGAYLPLTRFSGGGGSNLAMELGFGLSLGPTAGRLTGIIEYEYQRIDREVSGNAVPIRYSVARVGVAARR